MFFIGGAGGRNARGGVGSWLGRGSSGASDGCVRFLPPPRPPPFHRIVFSSCPFLPACTPVMQFP